MDAIFIKVLNMSIVTSFLILAVIVLRLFSKKAPKWIRCIMWAMVGIRLIVPFSFESRFSLIPNAQMMNETSYSSTSYINSIESYASNQTTAEDSPDIISIISLVWIIGVAVMLIYMIFSYIRLRLMVRERVRIKDNIWLCDHIRSPFVLGFFRPQIYLLSSISERETEYVIAHEQAHLKRLDNIWKPLGFVLLSVNWFNPFCWIAYWLFNKDIELACDEKVVKTLDAKGKKVYSTALLFCSSNLRMAFACPLAFGENNVKQRIKSILSYKKPAIYIVVATVAVCIVVAVLFMTNPLSVSASSDVRQIAQESEITPVATQTTTESVAETTVPVTEKPTEKVTEPTTKPTEVVEENPETEYVPDDNYYDDSEYYDSYTEDSYTDENRNNSILEIQEIPEINPDDYAHKYDGYSTSNDDNFGLSPQTNPVDNDVFKWDLAAP